LGLEALIRKNMKYLGLIILLVLATLLFGFRALTVEGSEKFGAICMVMVCLGTTVLVIDQSIKHK
jgi:hypothetical protein